MGLDIDFLRGRNDPKGILDLRGHGYLLDLIFAQEPRLVRQDRSDMVIDARVLAGLEQSLRAEMAVHGIAPAKGSLSLKKLRKIDLDPEGPLEELLPYYLQVTQELRRWAEEYIELVRAWSA